MTSDGLLYQVREVGEALSPLLVEDANVIFGTSIDTSLPDDEVIVSLIATGFAPPQQQPRRRSPPPSAMPSQDVSSPPPLDAAPPDATPYDLFAYHPPQPKLLARDGASVAEESLRRYDEYLCERTYGEGIRVEPTPTTAPDPEAQSGAQHGAQPRRAAEAPKPAAVAPTAEEQLEGARWYDSIVARKLKAERDAHEAAHDGRWGI